MRDGSGSDDQARAIEAAAQPFQTLDQLAANHGAVTDVVAAVAAGALGPQSEPNSKQGIVTPPPILDKSRQFKTSTFHGDASSLTALAADDVGHANSERLVQGASATTIQEEAKALTERADYELNLAGDTSQVPEAFRDQNTPPVTEVPVQRPQTFKAIELNSVRPESIAGAKSIPPPPETTIAPSPVEFVGQGPIPATSQSTEKTGQRWQGSDNLPDQWQIKSPFGAKRRIDGDRPVVTKDELKAVRQSEPPSGSSAQTPEPALNQVDQSARVEAGLQETEKLSRVENPGRRLRVEDVLDPELLARSRERRLTWLQKVGRTLHLIREQTVGAAEPVAETAPKAGDFSADQIFRQLEDLYTDTSAASLRALDRQKALRRTAQEISQTVRAHEMQLDTMTDPVLRRRFEQEAGVVRAKAFELVQLIEQQQPVLAEEEERTQRIAQWTRDTRLWLTNQISRLWEDPTLDVMGKRLTKQLEMIFSGMRQATTEMAQTDQFWQQLDSRIGQHIAQLTESNGQLKTLFQELQGEALARRAGLESLQQSLFDTAAVADQNQSRQRWAKGRVNKVIDQATAPDSDYWLTADGSQSAGLSLARNPFEQSANHD